jgi:hypothetical protein
MLSGRKAFASVISRCHSRLSSRLVNRAQIYTSIVSQRKTPISSTGTRLNHHQTSQELFQSQKSIFLPSNASYPAGDHSKKSSQVSPLGKTLSRQDRRTAKQLRSALRILCSSPQFLRLCAPQRRNYSSGDKNSSDSKKDSSSHRSEKYSEFLRRRLGVWRQTFRRFFGAGQPFTLDKFLPVFNLMAVAIATSVLIGTTSIISLIVWIVNRNERWRGS